VTGLANGTSYTFTVTATNAVGTGPASVASNAVVPATVPGPPGTPTATRGNSQATVTWAAPVSNGGSAIGGYTVTSSPGSFVASTTGALAATVTGLTNGTSYTFTVVATNAVGTGPTSTASNAVVPATVPGAPGTPAAVRGNAQVTLKWTAPPSNGSADITGYTATSSPGGFTASTTGALTVPVTGLANGTSYTFTVTATNAVGTGPASAASSVVAPAAPGWIAVSSGTTNDLNAIWGSGPNDVWAVGMNGTILHWNGTAWASVPSGTVNQLYGAWGSGPSDVWAVGSGGTILHWNGAAWASVPSGETDNIYTVWGSGQNDVWTWVNSAPPTYLGKFLHWNGSAWSNGGAFASRDFYHIWGSGPDDVWAMGPNGCTMHWNGTAWTLVASGTLNYLYGIWGNSASDVWAVGRGGAILRWNGSAWSGVTSGTTGDLACVWSSGPSDVWAAGASGTLLRWNGTAWSGVASGTTKGLGGVWGSGSTDVWAVGAAGTILRGP
jgi:hypothetical protein